MAVKQIRMAKDHVVPGTGIVAIGACARIVTGWWQMAGPAVDQSAVVERDLIPALRRVAIGALAGIVASR